MYYSENVSCDISVDVIVQVKVMCHVIMLYWLSQGKLYL